MSDQRERAPSGDEIHVRLDKLQEFLLGGDREMRIHALTVIDGISGSEARNAPEVHAKIIEMLNSNIDAARNVLLNGDNAEQALFLNALNNMSILYGEKCPDLAIAAIDAGLETKNIMVRESAKNLLVRYMKNGVNREGIMRALIGEAALGLSWENADFFGTLGTFALQHNETRQDGLVLLANIASHQGVKHDHREMAFITIEVLLLKGNDISCIEKEVHSMAKKRDPFSETAKALLTAAELRGFNRPDGMGHFKKIEVGLTPVVAPAPLRRTGTNA